MSDRYRSLLLFGAPGVGKGTQGALLAKVPGFRHMSTGEMFRNMDRNTELGRVFTQYSQRGELVPDELTIRLWGENVNAQRTLGLYKPDRDTLLLDGIPRTTNQARLMEGRIEVLGIVHMTTADPDVMVDRLRERALKEGRVDDANEDTIRRRFEVYRSETQPMLDHYSPELVHNVEAVGSPAAVLLNILKVIVPALECEKPCSDVCQDGITSQTR